MHSDHLPMAGSQVVELNCCDEEIALHSLLYLHDLHSFKGSFVKWS